MSRDASGNYTLPPIINPVQPGTVIDVNWANPTLDDVAVALTDSLDRKGKGGMSAPLVMNGYKVTGIGFATQPTDAPQATQVRDQSFIWLTSSASDASGNNYVGTALLPTPPLNGAMFQFLADKTNTGAMTLALNGAASLPILIHGAPIPPGLIRAGAVLAVIYLNLTYRFIGLATGGGTVNSVQSADPALISVVNDSANSLAVLHPHANTAGGMTKLDGGGKIPIIQLPFTDLHFVGAWNAAPGALPSQSGIFNGNFYIITGAGTLPLFRVTAPDNNIYTSQSTPVAVGDAIILKLTNPPDANAPNGWYYDPQSASIAVASTVVIAPPTPTLPAVTDVQAWVTQMDPIIASKLPKAGGTMTGPIHQPAAPSTGTELANRTYVDGKVAAAGGVTSFNARTGAVTLTYADVAGPGSALGYVPVNPASANFTAHVTGTTAAFTGGIRSLYYQPYLFASNIGGTTSVSMFNGQVQNLGLVSDLILTSIDDMVGGAIMRLVFNATTWSITWPANVYWPMGVIPSLAAGPYKVAVVILFYTGGGSGSGANQGGTILASAVMY